MIPNAPYAVENAEDALTGFVADNDGPLWGDAEDAQYAALAAILSLVYAANATPKADRIVGF